MGKLSLRKVPEGKCKGKILSMLREDDFIGNLQVMRWKGRVDTG